MVLHMAILGYLGRDMGAKTGTGTMVLKLIHNIIYLIMQRKTCGLTALHSNTLCQCGWASES